MFDQFVRPVSTAMPAIAEIIKSKPKVKAALDPNHKERDWKEPFADWTVELGDDGDERLLRELTRTQVSEIIKRRQQTWKPPVSKNQLDSNYIINSGHN